MKRFFDIVLGIVVATLLAIPMLTIAVLIRLTSKGPVLYWSDRVGRENAIFQMPKFRTMRIDTPQVASHLLDDPKRWMTPVGNFLRRTSMDEFPQLWTILKGEMSFVGPRPALYNQDDLVALRISQSVHKLPVGLTGWAQVNGRDESPIPEKVAFDRYYLEHGSLWFDIKILFITAWKVIRREGTASPDDVAKRAESITPTDSEQPRRNAA